MKVGIKLGKVKKFGIGWCIHHRMAADNAEGGSGQTPLPPLKQKEKKKERTTTYERCWTAVVRFLEDL